MHLEDCSLYSRFECSIIRMHWICNHTIAHVLKSRLWGIMFEISPSRQIKPFQYLQRLIIYQKDQLQLKHILASSFSMVFLLLVGLVKKPYPLYQFDSQNVQLVLPMNLFLHVSDVFVRLVSHPSLVLGDSLCFDSLCFACLSFSWTDPKPLAKYWFTWLFICSLVNTLPYSYFYFENQGITSTSI